MSLDMKYFVLNPKSKSSDDEHARASRAAMREYAKIIKETDFDMAMSLIVWVESEENKLDE